MTAVLHDTAADRATVPGAFQTYLQRTIPGFGLITFEEAPAGWLTPDGQVRRADWRAYHFTAEPFACAGCDGDGRVAGKREGTTKKCPACDATGLTKRRRLTSVTTLLGEINPKPGLPPWAEARGIEGAIQAVAMGEINPRDPASVAQAVETVRRLRLGADRARDDAADRGLNVHDLWRVYNETGSPPNPADHPVEHHGFIRGLSRFLMRHEVEPVEIEQLVANPADGYAGRYDLLARDPDGTLVLWDAKTQERGQLYPEVHVQVELYERARVACGDEPSVLRRAVVFAADGGFRVMDSKADPALVEAALEYARRLKPVTSACESANRVEREARKAAA